MTNKRVKTKSAGDIITIAQEMGDEFVRRFQKSRDAKDAQIALTAYNTAIKTAQAQTTYKKLTHSKKAVDFFKMK